MGTATGVAANRDCIDNTVAGSGEPGGAPGLIKITEVQTITGGTGRNAGGSRMPAPGRGYRHFTTRPGTPRARVNVPIDSPVSVSRTNSIIVAPVTDPR